MTAIGPNYSILDYYRDVNTDFLADINSDITTSSSSDLDLNRSEAGDELAAQLPDRPSLTTGPSDIAAFGQALDDFINRDTLYSSPMSNFMFMMDVSVSQDFVSQLYLTQSEKQGGLAQFTELVELDPDGENGLSLDEFQLVMNDLSGGTVGYREEDEEMFELLDKNGDQHISMLDYFA